MTDAEALLFAMKNYDNIHIKCVEEFEEDFKRLTYVKKLLLRYARGEELQPRLVLNHLIVLYNVFSNAATTLLVYKMNGDKDALPALNAFLLYLNRVTVEELDFSDIDADVIVKLKEL